MEIEKNILHDPIIIMKDIANKNDSILIYLAIRSGPYNDEIHYSHFMFYKFISFNNLCEKIIEIVSEESETNKCHIPDYISNESIEIFYDEYKLICVDNIPEELIEIGKNEDKTLRNLIKLSNLELDYDEE